MKDTIGKNLAKAKNPKTDGTNGKMRKNLNSCGGMSKKKK